MMMSIKQSRLNVKAGLSFFQPGKHKNFGQLSQVCFKGPLVHHPDIPAFHLQDSLCLQGAQFS